MESNEKKIIDKKIFIKKFTKIFLGIFVILFIILSIIQNITNNIILLNFWKIYLSQTALFFILSILIFITASVYLINSWDDTNSKIARFLKLSGWLLLLSILAFGYLIFSVNDEDLKYYKFSSPDNKHSIIVKEDNSTYGSSIVLYERINPFFISSLNISTSIKKGLSPISHNQYRIKWDKNILTFDVYNFFTNDTWERFKVDLDSIDKKVEFSHIDSNGNIIPQKKQTSNKTIIDDTNKKDNKISKKEKLDEIQKKLDEIQKKLDAAHISNLIKIDNSNYGIIEVDRAMAQSLWYFVEIKEDKLIFISEAPDMSPKVEGNIDSKGVIHLKFEDIHNNTYKFKSENKGLNWIKE